MDHLDSAKLALSVVALMVAAGLVGALAAKKAKVPDIVVFLFLGIILGPVAHLLAVPQDSTMNQLLLTIGACYLLFEGGTALEFGVLKEIWITLLVLSTLGVLLTGTIMALVSWWIGIPVFTALLLGMATASTDPATLVPVFKQVPIRPRVAQTVLGESAFNDAVGTIATFAVVGIIAGNPGPGIPAGPGWDTLVADLGWEAGSGIVIGTGFGLAASFLMAHRTFGVFRGSEPFVLLVSLIVAFLSADALKGSGFMAVFVSGVMVGNRERFGLKSEDHHQKQMEHYSDTTALVLRMLIFILLGSQVDLGQLAAYWWQGLVLLAVFLFVARPLTVFVCAGPDRRARWTFHELLFMSWTRETGVIPAALVGILSGMKVPGMEVVSPIAFILILGTILVQAPTTAWAARHLGLLQGPKAPNS